MEKEIHLNSQATDWLIDHLSSEVESGNYSNTSKGIMQHIISKLTKNNE